MATTHAAVLLRAEGAISYIVGLPFRGDSKAGDCLPTRTVRPCGFNRFVAGGGPIET